MFYGLMSRSTILLGLVLTACSATPPQVAHTALDLTSIGVDHVDSISADVYTAHARVALAAASTLPEYTSAMVPYDTLESALVSTHSLLLAADEAINAWDAGGHAQWLALAACIFASLSNIEDSLQTMGVTLPPELTVAISAMVAFAGTCPPALAAPSSTSAAPSPT